MPQMIREMVLFFFEQKLESRLCNFVTFQQIQEKISTKLDTVKFREFQKLIMEKESVDNTFYKIDE